MFRRRRPRRPMRPLRGGMRPGHQMMEAGNYQGAAEQFKAIARTAESRGGPRATQFYLQSGRARILAGHNEAGLDHLKHGLSLLAQRADWPHLHRAGTRTVAELNQRGLSAEADEISEFLNANLPDDFAAPQSTIPARKPVLPTHCPSCGGALRPDEVDWLDGITAECAYCGSPVREVK